MPTWQPPSQELAVAQADVSAAVRRANLARMRGTSPPASAIAEIHAAGLRLRAEHARATAAKHAGA